MERILVVDDDDPVRSLVEIVARRAGFVVDSAVDGLDAVELLGKNSYLLLVLDLMMPRLDGYEVIRQLATAPGRPAIIVVTAMAESHLEALDSNIVHAVVRKPFDVNTMADILTAAASDVRSRTPDSFVQNGEQPEARLGA